MFRPEMLLPMGLPEDVRVIAWGLSLERYEFLIPFNISGSLLILSCFLFVKQTNNDIIRYRQHPRFVWTQGKHKDINLF